MIDLTDGPLAGQQKTAWKEETILAFTRQTAGEWFWDLYYRVGVLKYKHLSTHSGMNPKFPFEGWELPGDAMPVPAQAPEQSVPES